MRPAHTIKSLLSRTKRNGECLEFSGAKSSIGYGYVGYKGKVFKAHRLAYLLQHGALSEDVLVLHRCDNRACINPNHLFLGTHHDNAVDMVAKGRHSRCGGRKSKIN